MEKSKYEQRRSGIELLKIIAIFLIVIFHVTQSLVTKVRYVGFDDYVYVAGVSTKNLQALLINFLCYLGNMGNLLFFVCSSWFLAGNKKTGEKKVLPIIFNVWTVSVLWLIAFLVIGHVKLPVTTIIKQFFPTSFSNNWYMTCYTVFLFIYPLLNIIIDKLTQKQLLRTVFVFGFLYIMINFLLPGSFFATELSVWITVYFLIAYIKLYMPEYQNDKKANLAGLLFGFVCFTSIFLITNFLGLHINFLSDKLLYWDNICNPFEILTAVCLFNLFRQLDFNSKIVNYLSSLSMLIYLIHENVLFRRYYRPYIWRWIYNNLGYENIILWISVFSAALFAAAALLSVIYKYTFQKVTSRISDKAFVLFGRIWTGLEKRIINLK